MNWNQRFARRTAQMKRSAVRELLKVIARPEIISFAGGLPAPELFPVAELRAASNAVLEREGRRALQYAETEGVSELREWLAVHFSQPGRRIKPANVLITSGAQQGLDLIGRVLLEEGDQVVVENPTYLALLSAWRPLGVAFLATPGDADGLRTDSLEPLLRRRPKLLYTIPNFQNPQGTTLSLERRARLVKLARAHGVGIVEDNPYGELRFGGEPLPHLLDLDTQSAPTGGLEFNVIHTGTFSKVLAPGLRVGWVVGSETVVDKLVQAKQAADLHTSTLNQLIAFQLLTSGLLDHQLPRLRLAYQQRRDAMLTALATHFPEGLTWTRPAGGMFLLVTLPTGWDASEILVLALRQNVAFVPGEDFHLEGQGHNTFRLNYSNARPDQIEEGIRRLGGVLRDYALARK